jgi:alpha/beta superfamily hydrolase
VARRIESHWLPGPAGRLEALLEEPEEAAPSVAAVVCHPHPLYGGTLNNKVVFRIARGLRGAGAVVLRFNFRGVGKSEGEHAHLTGEIEDARAALDWLRARYPAVPFALAGFSFGARVVTRLACDHQATVSPSNLQWVMAAGFPTRMGDARYLETCTVPKIFIQSEHDQFGPRPELEALYDTLPAPKQIHWIESADHFFAGALDRLEETVRASLRA